MRSFMKYFLFTSVLSLAHLAGAFAVQTPSYVNTTMYAFAVSKNADCSEPIVVFESPQGVPVDMTQSPTIGGGSVPDGTYPCVIMKMSDQIKFKVPNTELGCQANTEYTINICNTNGGSGYQPMTISGGTATFGSTTACRGTFSQTGTAYEDIVPIFMSTISPSSGSDTFMRPTSTTYGIQLTNPLVISGSKAVKFIMNFNNAVTGSASGCDCNAPTFGFQ